jgi:hypothetical protein
MTYASLRRFILIFEFALAPFCLCQDAILVRVMDAKTVKPLDGIRVYVHYQSTEANRSIQLLLKTNPNGEARLSLSPSMGSNLHIGIYTEKWNRWRTAAVKFSPQEVEANGVSGKAQCQHIDQSLPVAVRPGEVILLTCREPLFVTLLGPLASQ